MDKRKQRTLNKMAQIKRTALDLFMAHGIDKVTVDEIADAAHVSKVTVYNYFGSKEGLYAEVMNLYVEETLAATEAIIGSDQPFLDKLKAILQMQASSTTTASMERLFAIWEANPTARANPLLTLQNRVRELMFVLYKQGQQTGYVDEAVSFDVLLLYAEVFRAGIRTTLANMPAGHIPSEMLEELYRLYFYGFINKPT